MNPITAFKALSAGRKALAIGGMALLFALAIITAKHFIDSAFDAAKQQGAAQVTSEALQTTIERTEKANEAAETIASDPVAAYANCVRHSRTPENC